MSYRYATILRALRDDPHPDHSIEEGDLIIEPGKLEDGDEYTVLTDAGPAVVSFEAVSVYESDEPMGEREAVEFAHDQYVQEQEATA